MDGNGRDPPLNALEEDFFRFSTNVPPEPFTRAR